MSQPENILVRGVNWLGDAVMTTPALQRLREAKPRAQITLLTHAKLADLWRHHPALDNVIEFTNKEGLGGVVRKVRAGRFDTALIFPNSPRAALETFLARVPERIGISRGWRNLFLTRTIRPHPGILPMRKRPAAEVRQLSGAEGASGPTDYLKTEHQLHHYLALAAAMGANPSVLPPRLEVTDAEVAAVRERFGFRAPAGVPLLGINAGAEYGPAKRWPKERFIEAAVELQRSTGCHWWILGGKADVELATSIANEITAAKTGSPDSIRVLAGQTSLRELCAALKACRLVITNDTGPMHVAAAVGTRVIVPFGSTSPELTGPGLPGDPRHRLIKSTAPCSPCFMRECPIDFRCMQGISTAIVVEHAMSLLAGKP